MADESFIQTLPGETTLQTICDRFVYKVIRRKGDPRFRWATIHHPVTANGKTYRVRIVVTLMDG
jgi:hypothetical protein